MTQLYVYLTFNGNCSEAMMFYRDCLGGELLLQRVCESPMAAEWPAEVQQYVLNARLVNGSLVLMGSDMGSQGEIVRGNNISLALTCHTAVEIERFYAALSENGKKTHPLHNFFAGTIGSLTDKYGFSWTLYYDNAEEEGAV